MSSLMQHFENGTAFDRIRATYYDRKLTVHLSQKDKEYEERISAVRDIWLEMKSDASAEYMIIEKFGIKDRRQAWQLLQDAKTLWALSQRFDPVVELAIQKLWIDRTFEMSETLQDAKMRKAALDANERYIELQLKYAERNRQVSFNVSITLHMDYREFMSEEEYQSAKLELEEIKKKARKRFKNFEDAEYVDI